MVCDGWRVRLPRRSELEDDVRSLELPWRSVRHVVEGHLKACYIVGDEIYLFGHLWTTDHFDEHFHAYAVYKHLDTECFLIEQCELINFHPLHACELYGGAVHNHNGMMYIATRSSL